MTTRAETRHEILGLLTAGLELPLPPIPRRVLRVVVESLREAWSLVLQGSPMVVLAGAEPEVTAALEAAQTRPHRRRGSRAVPPSPQLRPPFGPTVRPRSHRPLAPVVAGLISRGDIGPPKSPPYTSSSP